MALGLTACGGQASSDNAEEAFVRLLQQSGAGQVTDVQNFELTGCVEAEGVDGYRCDTRGQSVLDIEGRQVPIPVSKTCAMCGNPEPGRPTPNEDPTEFDG